MKCQDPKNRSPSRRVFAIISRILPEVEGGILWSGYVGSIGQDGGVRNEAGGGGQYQVNSSRNGYNSSRYLLSVGGCVGQARESPTNLRPYRSARGGAQTAILSDYVYVPSERPLVEQRGPLEETNKGKSGLTELLHRLILKRDS